jgi:hypothetical protein
VLSFNSQEGLEMSEETAMQTNTTWITYADEYGEATIQWSHPEPPSQRWTNRATKRLARLKKKSLRKFLLTVELRQSLMSGAYLRLWQLAEVKDCEFLREHLKKIFQKEGFLVTEVILGEGRVDYVRDCVVRNATIHVV